MADNQGDERQDQHGNPQQGLAGEPQAQQRQGQRQQQSGPTTPTNRDRAIGREPDEQTARDDEEVGGQNTRDQQQGDDR